MKTLLKLSSLFLCLLAAAPTFAGDLLLTERWTAQKPPWTSTVDTHVDVNAEVLTAWRSISGNNGAMCQAVWKSLGPGISGAGNCIRNLYNTGNTCSFDQNPEISVDSRNNKATITLRTNNNRLNFTTSVQGACNVINTGDPNFTADVDVNATAVLSYNGSEVHVDSANAEIAHISLSGNNTQAQAIIGMGNVLGSITPVLNRMVGRPFDFSGPLNPSIIKINVLLAIARSELTLPGAVYSLGSDSNGILFEAIGDKCLPGQNPSLLPGTGETACMNNADWQKVLAVVKGCVAPGKVEAKCPAASDRGPKPPDGWFGNGSCVSCACASPRHWNASINACELRLNVP
ncbi:MAG: hypothetical protein ACLPZY_20880 [Terracidiphilus sp.]